MYTNNIHQSAKGKGYAMKYACIDCGLDGGQEDPEIPTCLCCGGEKKWMDDWEVKVNKNRFDNDENKQ